MLRVLSLPALLVLAVLGGCASSELINPGPARDGGNPPDDTGARPDLGEGDVALPDTGELDVIEPDADATLPDTGDVAVPDAVDADTAEPDLVTPGCPGIGCACTPATAATVCDGYPCVDGFCCASACDGACETCGAAGREGNCVAHPAGVDPDNDCTEQPASSCGLSGLCDGNGACAYWGPETRCNDGETCSTNDACDGTGVCRGEVAETCGPGAGNECCVGTCNDFDGCATYAGLCDDVCGLNELQVGERCNGCGLAGAVGTCGGGTAYRCDNEVRTPCQEVRCGGQAYWCTNVGDVWAWRTAIECDDKTACTYNDRCQAGACLGTPVTCDDTACLDRECNGTATCTSTPRVGNVCDDGNACSYNDRCDASGVCAGGATVSCVDSPCIDRECNGTASCVETIRTGAVCDDGNACTWGDFCSASGVCQTGTPISCSGLDTTCATYSCNGTASCLATARNVGGVCDDGNAATDFDVCTAAGTCQGDAGCPPPAEACTTGTQNRRGCNNARVISRLTAGGTGGAVINDTTCSAYDEFDDSSGCWDANADHTYRIYLRRGERVTARYQNFSGCSTSTWYGTLKFFTTPGCDNRTCGTKVYCDYNERDQTASHTAERDGWLIIVADGSSAFDDEGTYRLTVTLTCRDGNCGCL